VIIDYDVVHVTMVRHHVDSHLSQSIIWNYAHVLGLHFAVTAPRRGKQNFCADLIKSRRSHNFDSIMFALSRAPSALAR
jgi:hypothetical protein